MGHQSISHTTEVNISDKYRSCLIIMDLVVKASLSKTISKVGPFYPRLIREFIMNLPSDFNDPSSLNYQLVHIRGSQFKISPSIINSFIGNDISSDSTASQSSNEELDFILSGGTLSVWSVNGIPAVSLNKNKKNLINSF